MPEIPNMPFEIIGLQFNFLDIIVKGMVIGIMCSAPMGPVGILCVQRTLNKGRWYGFVTGIGATLSDFIYALITGFGMSFVMELIDNPQNKFFLQISGSILLFCFGVYCFKSDPRKKVHESRKNQKGTLKHNFWTAFFVTFSNPLIIFRSVCICRTRPSVGDVPGIPQHHRRGIALVVRTHVAYRQSERILFFRWHYDNQQDNWNCRNGILICHIHRYGLQSLFHILTSKKSTHT